MATSVTSASPAFSLLTALSHDSFGAVLASLHVAEVCVSLAAVATEVRASAQRALSLPRRVVHRGDKVDGAPHEWLERVCAAGANVRTVSLVTEADGGRLLLEACTAGFSRVVDVALRCCCPRVDANARDQGGNTPLHLAAYEGHVNVVDRLLHDDRVEVDARNEWGKTPLHWAAIKGHVNVVDRLLRDDRVEVSTRDQYGNTPLHFAAASGHVNVVDRLLRDDRVEVNARNQGGQTPLHIADCEGFADIVALLKRDHRCQPTP